VGDELGDSQGRPHQPQGAAAGRSEEGGGREGVRREGGGGQEGSGRSGEQMNGMGMLGFAWLRILFIFVSI
jgi:hypothetical protein